MHLVGRLAGQEPAMRPVIERIGGIASDRDQLWQQMLPAEQVVFPDDMAWNVEGARRAGMTAVQVPWDGPGPAIDTARKLLRLPPRPSRTIYTKEQACR